MRLDAFPAFAGRQSWSGGKTRWINALRLIGWFYRGHWRHWAWWFLVQKFYSVKSCCIYCTQDSQQALVDPTLVQVKAVGIYIYIFSTFVSTCKRYYSRVCIVAIVTSRCQDSTFLVLQKEMKAVQATSNCETYDSIIHLQDWGIYQKSTQQVIPLVSPRQENIYIYNYIYNCIKLYVCIVCLASI